MGYDGEYYHVITEIVQKNMWATSHMTNSNISTSEHVRLPPNLNNLKLPPNQTPSYKTWASIYIQVIVIVLLCEHITGLLLRWQLVLGSPVSRLQKNRNRTRPRPPKTGNSQDHQRPQPQSSLWSLTIFEISKPTKDWSNQSQPVFLA